MAHILAIRFSALGDIAMTVPILYSFAMRYPEHEVTLLSRPMAAPLFEHLPANIHFKGVNLKNYEGITGLYRLSRELQEKHFDAVADLHDVVRTIVLRHIFSRRHIPTSYIDKGRYEKRKLTRSHHKELYQLTPSPERYALVFAELGYPFPIHFTSLFPPEGADISPIADIVGERQEGEQWIGIAPFAAHKGKIYPLSQMERVIALLSQNDKNRIFLFGAGEKEKNWCEKWDKTYPHVTSLVGRMKMNRELALMSHLDTMLSMDSVNMHLASLAGTPVVSIWGATHPFAGFTGIQTAKSKTLQVELPCRPCSIFGNKKCRKGDYECLWSITPQEIVAAIEDICQNHHKN